MSLSKLFGPLVIAFSLAACAEQKNEKEEQGRPSLVLLTPDFSNPHKGIPVAAAELLETLVDKNPEVKNVIGGTPFQKMQAHSVTAYIVYDDGWLLASGRGEWGGVVFWLSRNGDYEIIRDDDLAYPINAVLHDNRVFLSQGMAHLSISDGHILEINRKQGAFETKIYPLQGYPRAFEKVNGQLIVPISPRDEYYVVSELQAGRSKIHTR